MGIISLVDDRKLSGVARFVVFLHEWFQNLRAERCDFLGCSGRSICDLFGNVEYDRLPIGVQEFNAIRSQVGPQIDRVVRCFLVRYKVYRCASSIASLPVKVT